MSQEERRSPTWEEDLRRERQAAEEERDRTRPLQEVVPRQWPSFWTSPIPAAPETDDAA